MFNNSENNLIQFGKFIILRSIQETKEEGDNLNTIDYEYLIENVIRDITDKELVDYIKGSMQMRDLGIVPDTDWRDGKE